MINFIKYAYYGLFSLVCLMSTAIIAFIPVFIFSLVKLLIPIKSIRYLCTSAVQYSVSLWVSFVILIAKFFSPTKIEIEQNKELDKSGSYLIICNHKSWLDTFVLMMIFHKKIAFPKFFMKFQVFFIPVLGLIAWALEFPAMKRYKKEYLKKHPEKKGEDLKKTVEYCKKLSSRPTTIVNFVEGTRYTSQKALKSAYKNLLNPKAGGIAVILKSLSDRMVGVLNTTIVYDNPKQTLWDYMIRKTKKIKVKVDFIPISEVPMGDYFTSETDKEYFQVWLNKLWQTNDEYISKDAKKITY
ncbi:acyltransferase [Francisella orientalis]|uniref:Acyltransferase n=2 Tax=Francisella orientalis TaxID=299583 RepID=A0AAP7C557_9GAMM|nr:acyltransferase [Francisella orientalis]AHB97837.1 acyltransferase [Francisella orientalis LADL 07-285A]AKN84935.1 1-acylglycerol-3-phosphate acyltransferase [Francisella orientalis FNO12]AKN86473.1 1-acylglycerol-3-phosphate acyltransferase [Francisella orientalis FNO24]AKN88011.1 1-acylglycerol-3-phosphate acyltransferase [Francisella orientalis]AKU04765.1 1-acylglycerol-3-phosphate acyltransferase [Francisella orientalis]